MMPVHVRASARPGVGVILAASLCVRSMARPGVGCVPSVRRCCVGSGGGSRQGADVRRLWRCGFPSGTSARPGDGGILAASRCVRSMARPGVGCVPSVRRCCVGSGGGSRQGADVRRLWRFRFPSGTSARPGDGVILARPGVGGILAHPGGCGGVRSPVACRIGRGISPGRGRSPVLRRIERGSRQGASVRRLWRCGFPSGRRPVPATA